MIQQHYSAKKHETLIGHVCGHTQYHADQHAPGAKPAWFDGWLASAPCVTCLQREREVWAARMGLPKLDGTKKQVAWAEKIRLEALEAYDDCLAGLEAQVWRAAHAQDVGVVTPRMVLEARNVVKECLIRERQQVVNATDAGLVIANRDRLVGPESCLNKRIALRIKSALSNAMDREWLRDIRDKSDKRHAATMTRSATIDVN